MNVYDKLANVRKTKLDSLAKQLNAISEDTVSEELLETWKQADKNTRRIQILTQLKIRGLDVKQLNKVAFRLAPPLWLPFLKFFFIFAIVVFICTIAYSYSVYTNISRVYAIGNNIKLTTKEGQNVNIQMDLFDMVPGASGMQTREHLLFRDSTKEGVYVIDDSFIDWFTGHSDIWLIKDVAAVTRDKNEFDGISRMLSRYDKTDTLTLSDLQKLTVAERRIIYSLILSDSTEKLKGAELADIERDKLSTTEKSKLAGYSPFISIRYNPDTSCLFISLVAKGKYNNLKILHNDIVIINTTEVEAAIPQKYFFNQLYWRTMEAGLTVARFMGVRAGVYFEYEYIVPYSSRVATPL